MRLTLLSGVAGVLCAGQLTAARPDPKGGNLTPFIHKEGERSLQGILDNLGGRGKKTPGTAAGLFIASPNTENPDCKWPGWFAISSF